jgi:hypothetical protein
VVGILEHQETRKATEARDHQQPTTKKNDVISRHLKKFKLKFEGVLISFGRFHLFS